MIYEVKMFSAKCDNCDKEYMEAHNGWSAMSDESGLVELMSNDDWHVHDDGNKHYCSDCYTIDDEDNLIIKENPLK